MAGQDVFKLSDAAHDQFQKLKAEEKAAEDLRAEVIADHDRRVARARDLTASFLNGVAAQLGIPPQFLFIEEFGEFRANRKRESTSEGGPEGEGA